MSRVGDWIRRKFKPTPPKSDPSSDKSLGPVYVTPKEKKKLPPSDRYVVPTPSRSGGRGGSSRSDPLGPVYVTPSEKEAVKDLKVEVVVPTRTSSRVSSRQSIREQLKRTGGGKLERTPTRVEETRQNIVKRIQEEFKRLSNERKEEREDERKERKTDKDLGIVTASTYQSGQGTASYERNIIPIEDVKTQPYIIEKPTGETIEVKGQKFQIFNTTYVDPTVTGKQFERPATDKEMNLLETSKSALSLETGTASTGKKPFKYKVLGEIKNFETWAGVDLTSEQKGFKATEDFLAGGAEKIIPGKAGEITGGIIRGIIPTTPKEVVVTGLTFGAGALLGAGVKGLSATAKLVPKYGSLLSSGVKGGAAIGGAYLTGAYVLDVGKQVSATEDYGEKGEIIGETAREFLALGSGYKAGSKYFDTLSGKWMTRGRTEIPIERLVSKEVLTGEKIFPTASTETHLKLFKGTAERFPELAEGRAGAFHTTPDKFWTGTLKPKPGTSELPGLYASSDVSVFFSRIGETKITRLFPKTSELFAPEGKPGIAFIKPKRFRTSSWSGIGRKPVMEGGERFTEFAFWDKPAKPGVADIPKMKTEIESVFRTGAGEYAQTSGKYYTTYNGRRILLDAFEYTEKISPKDLEINNILNKIETKGHPFLKKGDYYLPIQEYALIEPRSSLFLSSSSVTNVPSETSLISYKPSGSSVHSIIPSIESSNSSSERSSRGGGSSKVSLSVPSKVSLSVPSEVSKIFTPSSLVSYKRPESSYKQITPPYDYTSRKTEYPKPKPSPSPYFFPKSSTAKDIIKAMNGKFIIFAKEKGVDVEIGKAKTAKEAKSLLKKKLKGTLRASGFIEKAGRKIEIGNLGEGFRRSKKDLFRIVEKKEKRIKRKGRSREAEEIQFFRGKQRGRKNGFF